MCNCKLCQRHKRFNKVMKTYKFSKSDAKWLDEQFDIFLNVEADLEYKDCILNGQWPTAVKILERCLEKAKLVQAKKVENEHV